MTRHRRGRPGEEGQAVVFVALAMIAMLSVVGLAIDGGMAAGSYRTAQNATDAGALSGAERIYTTGATATKQQLCNVPSPGPLQSGTDGGATPGYGPAELAHNRTTAIACHPEILTTYKPGGPNGYTGSSAIFTADTTANVIGVATVSSHLGVGESSGSVIGGATPSASGSVDVAALNAQVSTLLGGVASSSTGVYQCSSSQTGTGTNQAPASGLTCPSAGTLALSILGVNVDAAIGLTQPALAPGLLTQQSTSTVTATPTEQQDSSTNVVQWNGLHVGGITANIGAGSASTCLGMCTGLPGVVGHVNLADVSLNLLGSKSIQVTDVDVSASIDYVPGKGFVVSPVCTVASAAVAGSAAKGTVTFNGSAAVLQSDCSYTAINWPGVATVGSSVSVPACTSSGGLTNCTASVCLLKIQLLSFPGSLTSVSACLGSVNASTTFTPVTQEGAVLLSGHVPTKTYFMRVVGITQTDPSTTAAAMPQQVIDETQAQFLVDPYAVPNINKPTGGGCTAVYGPLIPGCQYRLYGNGVPDDATADKKCETPAAGCWHGLLANSSPHAAADPVVGKTAAQVNFAEDDGPGMSTNYGSYALLPVIDSLGSQVVIEYGLFQLAGDTHFGTLMKSVPAGGTMPPIAEESALYWNPYGTGAIAIKLVDSTVLTCPVGSGSGTCLGYTPQ